MSSIAERQTTGAVVDTAPSSTRVDDVAALDRPAPNLKGGRLSTRATHRLIGFGSIIGLLVLWQVLADTNVINTATASDPSDVWNMGRQMVSDGTLGSAIWSSAGLYGAGLGVAILIGVIGGIILGWWRILGAIFDPWIAILYSTPLVALLPLVLVWFGITFKAQVVMVVLVSVFPLLVNVMVGTRQVDPGLLRLAKSFRGSQFAVLRTLVLPSLVPYIVTGLRLAAGGGLIGVTVAEYFMGNNGIGGMILRDGTELNTAGTFVGIVVLAGASLTILAIIRTVERRVSGWRED